MSIDLFAPNRIGKLEMRNRFVRSATWDASADDSGAATDNSVAVYQQLGQGGVGLIMTGYAFVSPLGQAIHGQYGAHIDDMIPGLRRLVQAAHQGGAKIALQVVHAGINSHYLQPDCLLLLSEKDVAPSRNFSFRPGRLRAVAVSKASPTPRLHDMAAFTALLTPWTASGLMEAISSARLLAAAM